MMNENDVKDLPTSLIVTSVDPKLFTDADLSATLQLIFSKFEDKPTFQYFKNFGRVRVNYETSLSAARARVECDGLQIGDQCINCYFAGPILSSNATNGDVDSTHLKPPKLEKQFLISPPASPPDDWQPVDEARPLIDMELLSALAGISADGSHQLHEQTEFQPAIVVHACDQIESQQESLKPKLKIQHTSRPFLTH